MRLTCHQPTPILMSLTPTSEQSALQGAWLAPSPIPPFFPSIARGSGLSKNRMARVITHLSAPEGLSINDYIDPESVILSYTTVDDAIRIAWERHTFGKNRSQESFLTMPRQACRLAPSRHSLVWQVLLRQVPTIRATLLPFPVRYSSISTRIHIPCTTL